MKVMVVEDEQTDLEKLKHVIRQAEPAAEIICVENYTEALGAAKAAEFNVVLLDAEMRGVSGLTLAEKLQQFNPYINVIFIAENEKYAVEAFSIYASGYLIKPLRVEELTRALGNLRYPPEKAGKLHDKLEVQCFGNFEVFKNGLPVHFPRAKSKELFAYLVDLRGSSATTRELCGILFEDSADIKKSSHYIRTLISDIRKTLRECSAENVFITKRNQFSIDPGEIDCDYYRFLENDAEAVNKYRGEYMMQYSWAEFSMKYLE